ncbi:MAG: ferrous iron transport protein B [Bacillota bacterium]|nr:ferrous iron transport protein B [Bacillota bacterium]
MTIKIALAGNPNSGKTTLFNALTGSHQYVGNWPGVTVEKKEGFYRKDSSVVLTDLPGIYSLSPYTLEEVVARDFLLKEKPDAIINVVDGSNIERNLYLSTQLSELGIPLIIALNMMDLVRKNKDFIDIKKIERELNCKIVEVSALKNENIDTLINVAKELVLAENHSPTIKAFPKDLEIFIQRIEALLPEINKDQGKRWKLVKIFERDQKVLADLNLSEDQVFALEKIRSEAEEVFDDDVEGIVTNARYNFVSELSSSTVKKGRQGLTLSDKIDKIVTSKIFFLPIFIGVIFLVYFLAISVVGGDVTDWTNDVLFGEIIGSRLDSLLTNLGTSPMVHSLVMDGIYAGVTGVLGFLPVIASLFIFISLLEDIGYMSRIAFILDKIFRKFGLSGKSFIPILVGTGCSVPGIMATRTIENDADRRMTITVASMMPCGAKTDIIAMFAAVWGGAWWFGPLWYFGGILAVMVTGLILKKTARFQGDLAPFIMELPEYHLPSAYNIFRATWQRVKAFIVNAGTVILLASIFVWLTTNITVNFTFEPFGQSEVDSILAFVGKKIQWIFIPLGFGDWLATVATFLGLVAKEIVVSTFGIIANLGDLAGNTGALTGFIKEYFSTASMLSFMFFNQLTIPCFAAVGAIRQEMDDKNWTRFALGYIVIFSYTVSLMVYQFARVFIDGGKPDIGTFVGLIILVVYLYLIFRPSKYKK